MDDSSNDIDDPEATELPEGYTSGDVTPPGQREVEIPSSIGRYDIEAHIGSGTYADVYRAAHPHVPDLKVAIKRLKASYARSSSIRARFRQEARAVAILKDPHTVQLLDFGVEDEGSPYLVLEYVPGCSLRELLAEEERLSEGACARFALNVLQSLEEAHSSGIVHRDIKPENLLVTRSRVARYPVVNVADFGVARILGGTELLGESLSDDEQMIGTPSYCAPEVVIGEPEARSDLYSLGTVMAELLDGVAPYRLMSDSRAEVLRLQLSSNAVPLGPYASNSRLAEIIARALAKDRIRRWPSAYDMASAIFELLPDLECDGAISLPNEQGYDTSAIAGLHGTPAPVRYRPRRATDSELPLGASPGPSKNVVSLGLVEPTGEADSTIDPYGESKLLRTEVQSEIEARKAWERERRLMRQQGIVEQTPSTSEKWVALQEADRVRTADERGQELPEAEAHSEHDDFEVASTNPSHTPSLLEMKTTRVGIFALLLSAMIGVALLIARPDGQPEARDESPAEQHAEGEGAVDRASDNTWAKLTSDIPGVRIYADGQFVGETPVSGSILPEARPVELRFEREGFLPEDVVVPGQGAFVFEVSMVPVESPPGMTEDDEGEGGVSPPRGQNVPPSNEPSGAVRPAGVATPRQADERVADVPPPGGVPTPEDTARVEAEPATRVPEQAPPSVERPRQPAPPPEPGLPAAQPPAHTEGDGLGTGAIEGARPGASDIRNPFGD